MGREREPRGKWISRHPHIGAVVRWAQAAREKRWSGREEEGTGGKLMTSKYTFVLGTKKNIYMYVCIYIIFADRVAKVYELIVFNGSTVVSPPQMYESSRFTRLLRESVPFCASIYIHPRTQTHIYHMYNDNSPPLSYVSVNSIHTCHILRCYRERVVELKTE